MGNPKWKPVGRDTDDLYAYTIRGTRYVIERIGYNPNSYGEWCVLYAESNGHRVRLTCGALDALNEALVELADLDGGWV